MKNSKNKIVAAVICGMVLGSVGTSVVGNFQGKRIMKYIQLQMKLKAVLQIKTVMLQIL